MKQPLVVNFFGGPSSGKSCMTGGLFYNLKTHHHINCEMAREIAKVLVWAGQTKTLKDQDYVTSCQRQEIERVIDQVDVVICDSPLLLGSVYAPASYPECFHEFTRWTFDQYNNLNFMVNRTKPFDPKGRAHDETAALAAHQRTLELLTKYNVPYFNTESDGLDFVTETVLNHLRN